MWIVVQCIFMIRYIYMCVCVCVSGLLIKVLKSNIYLIISECVYKYIYQIIHFKISDVLSMCIMFTYPLFVICMQCKYSIVTECSFRFIFFFCEKCISVTSGVTSQTMLVNFIKLFCIKLSS